MSDLDLAGLVGPGLDVDADLRLQVTASSGETTAARVSGSGKRVRVDADRPEVLFAAVDRADVGRVADLLAATGVTVEVVGPNGPTATLGAGTSSRFGRVVTGSARVAPAPRAAVGLAAGSPVARVLALAVPAALVVYLAVRRYLKQR